LSLQTSDSQHFLAHGPLKKTSDEPLCYADTSRKISRNFSGTFDQRFMKFSVDQCLLKSIYSLVSSTYDKLVDSLQTEPYQPHSILPN